MQKCLFIKIDRQLTSLQQNWHNRVTYGVLLKALDGTIVILTGHRQLPINANDASATFRKGRI